MVTFDDEGTCLTSNDFFKLRYCYDDYSLSESAANYYSPYKLKASMVSRPETWQVATHIFFIFIPNLGEGHEDFHFDGCIFFKWVGEKPPTRKCPQVVPSE